MIKKTIDAIEFVAHNFFCKKKVQFVLLMTFNEYVNMLL